MVFLIGFKGCAQFLVHKDLILHLPFKIYSDIYNSGFYLEWTWHLFWIISPQYKIYNGVNN